jgi:fructose-1,6-bisphosphatase/inositol monophosphatase family enzyme
MEQAHQPATNNHINRYERLGTCRSIIPGVGINSWDCLARLLIVVEAGGVVSGTALQLELKVGGSFLAGAPRIERCSVW